jgi:hypothetical protein
MSLTEKVEVTFFKTKLNSLQFEAQTNFVHAAVSEIKLFKNWVFFPRSENSLFTSLILLNIVKNTRPMRKVMGNELEVYLFSFKLRSDG